MGLSHVWPQKETAKMTDKTIILQDRILNETELLESFGFKQRAKLRELFDRLRITYLLLPNGQVSTTMSSINMRLHGYGSTTKTEQANDQFA